MGKLLYILLLLPLSVCAQSIHITTPSDTVCHGFAITFTATDTGVAFPYYQWTLNGVALPGADSVLFVSDTLSNGDTVACLLTNSAHDTVIAHSNHIIITVQLPLSAGVITGTDSMVCVGATITLNDTETGGIWSASNNYATVSSGVVTGISGERIEDGFFPAKDTFYYIIGSSGCSDTAYKIIAIEPQPDAQFSLENPPGGDELCVDGYLLINDGDGVNFNGKMYATNGNASVDDAGLVSGVSPGEDYIYCIVTNICGSDTSGQSVLVYPAAAITLLQSPSPNVCVGSTITMIDLINAYPLWYASNGNASINYYTGAVTGLKPGLVTILLVAMNYCSSAQASITLTVEPGQPIIGIDSFCNGENVRFIDSTKEGIWNSSDTTIVSVDQAGNAKGLSVGTAVISYTFSSDGCTAIMATKVRPDFLPTPITGETEFCLNGVTFLSEATNGGIWSSNNTNVASVNVSGEVSGISVGGSTITYSFNGCIETKDISVSVCNDVMNIYPNPSHDEVTIYAFDNIYTTYSFINALGQIAIKGTLAGPFTKVDVAILSPGLYAIIVYGAQDRYVSKFVKD